MSWLHRKVVTAGNGVVFLGKSGRRQELLDQKVGELYGRENVNIDEGK